MPRPIAITHTMPLASASHAADCRINEALGVGSPPANTNVTATPNAKPIAITAKRDRQRGRDPGQEQRHPRATGEHVVAKHAGGQIAGAGLGADQHRRHRTHEHAEQV